jgi:hypothetical protein
MGVSPWFVELKIRSGELPALKLCRHYTILKEDTRTLWDSGIAPALSGYLAPNVDPRHVKSVSRL